jgi:23S rRNA pseudouridine1911/1915/1917 synthase
MARIQGKTRRAFEGEDAKRASLDWRALETGSVSGIAACLIEVELHTGLRHQIRAQLSELGVPVVGDGLYGGFSPSDGAIGLHAGRLGIVHPVSREKMTFECAPPPEWPWTSFEGGRAYGA